MVSEGDEAEVVCSVLSSLFSSLGLSSFDFVSVARASACGISGCALSSVEEDSENPSELVRLGFSLQRKKIHFDQVNLRPSAH